MARSFFAFLFLILPLVAAPRWLAAPVPDSPPVNQLRTDGNACGPACLLDAFRSGGPKWRRSIAQLDDKDQQSTSDQARLLKLIRTFGRRGSRLNPARYRWNGRFGINLADLADIANELRTERWMGTVEPRILYRQDRESENDLLRRTHRALARSLKKGLPPILGVRRVAWRTPAGGHQKTWLTVKRHFLVLTGLPARLPRGATSFKVTYHDPWGGRKHEGTIRIAGPQTTGLPTLVAEFPDVSIGRSQLNKKEPSCLSLSSALGLF